MPKITTRRAFAIAGFSALLFAWWALDSYTYQINCSIRLQYLEGQLQKTRQRTGSYPLELREADNENRPVLYLSDGKQFLLVSFGIDGHPDRSYSLDSPPKKLRPSCLGKNHDTVFAHDGGLVYCLN